MKTLFDQLTFVFENVYDNSELAQRMAEAHSKVHGCMFPETASQSSPPKLRTVSSASTTKVETAQNVLAFLQNKAKTSRAKPGLKKIGAKSEAKSVPSRRVRVNKGEVRNRILSMMTTEPKPISFFVPKSNGTDHKKEQLATQHELKLLRDEGLVMATGSRKSMCYSLSPSA